MFPKSKKKKIDPVYYVDFYVLDINLHNRPKLYFHIIFDIKFHIHIVWPLKNCKGHNIKMSFRKADSGMGKTNVIQIHILM